MERTPEGQIFPTDPTIPESSSYHGILKRLPILAGPLTAAGLVLGSTPAFAEQPKTPTNPTSPNNLYLPFSRNILVNGDYSQGWLGWQSKIQAEGGLALIDNHAGIDQSAAACIFFGRNASGLNEGEVYQIVDVRRNRFYHFRGNLTTQGVFPDQNGHGAYFTVESLPEVTGGYSNQRSNRVTSGEVTGNTQPTYIPEDLGFFSGNNKRAKVTVHLGPVSTTGPSLPVACADNLTLSGF